MVITFIACFWAIIFGIGCCIRVHYAIHWNGYIHALIAIFGVIRRHFWCYFWLYSRTKMREEMRFGIYDILDANLYHGCGSNPVMSTITRSTSSSSTEGEESQTPQLRTLHYAEWLWDDTIVDNIDEECKRLIQHPRDSAKKAECSRTTKRRLSHETVELIRQLGAARATGNYLLTSELARRCREAIKEDLKERRAVMLVEVVEEGRSRCNTRRDFANRKANVTALWRPDGTIFLFIRVVHFIAPAAPAASFPLQTDAETVKFRLHHDFAPPSHVRTEVSSVPM
ncbi:hypothetical protein Y032_0009g655 [Ancylostoma ceylanicum]|uniref:Uncharacterized protein n=1 Tax=Ancylostoma ceylanicum TaxID=53326 RepID=A0A016VIT1_9BILA|nr:hypothetical protein Y032_0009g655 [Ancylostoma ceylanicum]